MNWDALVESIAFGKAAQKTGPVLGMYLSPETIYIAQTRAEGAGKTVVEHLMRIQVPVSDVKPKTGTGTLNTSFLSDNQKLEALLKESMSHIHWHSRQVVITLSHHLSLLRYFTMPAVDQRFWKSAIPLEAKKHIPIPFDVLSYDYQCIPLPPNANNRLRQGALIAVTQKQNLANISALLKSLGLTPAGMEVAPCSVLRLWQALEPAACGKPYCQVHFDGGNVRLLIADRGLPVFFREVFLGAEADIADLRKVDIAGCLGFAQKQLAVGNLERLVISGNNPQFPSWKDALSREAGTEVSIQDTPALLGIKAGDWGGYAAIGASARFQTPSPMALDLSAVGRAREDEKIAARYLLLAGGMMTALFLALSLYRTALYQVRARALTAFSRGAAAATALQNKSQEEVEGLIKKMRDQFDALSLLGVARQTKPTDLIKDLIDCLPERGWVTSVLLSRNLKTPTMSGLNISAHVVGDTAEQEQDLFLQIKNRLSQTPTLAKAFPYINARSETKLSVAGAGDGQNQDALEKQREERTVITITASAKQK